MRKHLGRRIMAMLLAVVIICTASDYGTFANVFAAAAEIGNENLAGQAVQETGEKDVSTEEVSLDDTVSADEELSSVEGQDAASEKETAGNTPSGEVTGESAAEKENTVTDSTAEEAAPSDADTEEGTAAEEEQNADESAGDVKGSADAESVGEKGSSETQESASEGDTASSEKDKTTIAIIVEETIPADKNAGDAGSEKAVKDSSESVAHGSRVERDNDTALVHQEGSEILDEKGELKIQDGAVGAPEEAFDESFHDAEDDIDIRITAPEGVFPEGTRLNIRKIADDAEQDAIREAVADKMSDGDTAPAIERIYSYDIRFVGEDGSELKPENGTFLVEFSGSGIDMKKVASQDEEIGVFRMNDDRDAVEDVLEEVDTDADGLRVTAEDPAVFTLAWRKLFYAFEETKTAQGISVTVRAEEGVFAKDAELHVSEVEQNLADRMAETVAEQMENNPEEEIRKTYALDVTITGKDGTEYQPDNTKGRVTVSFASAEIAKAAKAENSDVRIFHAEDDDAPLEELLTDEAVKSAEGEASVLAEHFSIYVIAISDQAQGVENLYSYTLESHTRNYHQGDKITFKITADAGDGKAYWFYNGEETATEQNIRTLQGSEKLTAADAKIEKEFEVPADNADKEYTISTNLPSFSIEVIPGLSGYSDLASAFTQKQELTPDSAKASFFSQRPILSKEFTKHWVDNGIANADKMTADTDMALALQVQKAGDADAWVTLDAKNIVRCTCGIRLQQRPCDAGCTDEQYSLLGIYFF